jgi:isovaleryl-CoA dehydrogenase
MSTTPYPTLQFGHSETTEAIRETVYQFAKDKIAPIAADVDKSNQFPRDLWPEMGALGLHGITVSEGQGGLGLGYLEHLIAIEEVSRASASIGLSYGAHSNLCINQIERWGSEEQKAKYLPKLVSGEHLGSLAMSEPGAGSDVMSMKLKAESAQGGYLLNGNKMWITNAPTADTLMVYAKTDPSAGSKSVSAFLIERDFDGFSTAQKLDKLGMRGSDTCELVFENCFVPKDNLVGEIGQGAAILMSGLDYERVVLSAISIGIMQACLDEVLPYIHERKQFGKSIGEFQLIQGKMADMYVSLSTARA